jgi:hypothetical protein
MNIKILLVLLFLIILSIILYNYNCKENFIWNIPTRFYPSYDIRDYLNSEYYFLHNGRIYNNRYLNLDNYPNLFYYLPYYNNGMIYYANGSYTYNDYLKYYPDLPIFYQVPKSNIDWLGLRNNGILKKN